MNGNTIARKCIPTILAILVFLALPAICHAGCRLTEVKLIETETGIVGADLMVEGTPDIRRAPLDTRQVVFLGDCSCKKGLFSKKADGRILEKIRWNYHEDENRVHVVFYLTQKATPHIKAYDGRIRVLFTSSGNTAGGPPKPVAAPSPAPAEKQQIKDALAPEQPRNMDGLPRFRGTAGPIPPNIEAMIKMYSWRKDCPVPIPRLWLVQVTHLGYDGKAHQGRMIVNKSIAWEVVDIFRDIYKAGFPVQKMELIDEYKGDDLASMADNNSSAFNCRMVTGMKTAHSKHTGGFAIDINPLVNPYVKGDTVLPEQGAGYADRTKKKKGMIFQGDAAYRAFTRRGWIWGGSWNDLKDYQHFEKKE